MHCVGLVVNQWEEYELVTQNYFPEAVRRGELLVETLQPDTMLEQSQQLIARGAQAIIARGGTYRDLRSLVTRVPLVELRNSSGDILWELGQAAGQYAHIHLMLSDYTDFPDAAAARLLPGYVDYFRYHRPEELLRHIQEIPYTPNTLVLGGGFVVAPAREREFDARWIRSSEGSFRLAYETACQLLDTRERESQKAAEISAILDNIEDGVAVTDLQGGLLNLNRKGAELLSLQTDVPQGVRIGRLRPELAPVFQRSVGREKTGGRVLKVESRTLAAELSPIETPTGAHRLLLVVRDVTQLQTVEKNLRFQIAKRGMTARYHFEDILTRNRNMKQVVSWARRCADSESTVMIYGQSGTGKELFAQSIHNASRRKNGPFVAVNCAALTESLLESELFGYVGGAFTGARKNGKAGLFELAHGGTLFLDEINSMSQSTQAKILRVIEQKEVMRLGSDYIIPLDVRILAAANESLTQMVKENAFRRDLFFRLNVLKIRLPPLNQRPEDILFLFRRFAAEYLHCRPEDIQLSTALAHTLQAHNWWGNVRQLRNAAQRYAVLGGAEDAPCDAILDEAGSGGTALLDEDLHLDLKQLNRTVEGLVIESLLRRGLTKAQAAQVLGISRTSLFKKLEDQRNN